MIRKLNYKFQKKDHRDYLHKSVSLTKTLPSSVLVVNLNKMNILDQGNLGSCVSNAFDLCINVMTNYSLNSSRLFVYFNARAVAGYILEDDTGLEVRDCCKSISKYGVCLENIWPYNISLFSTLPSLSAYKKSFLFKNFVYSFVKQDIISIKNCLNNTRKPIVFGINVYSSFMTNQVAKTGIVPLPNINTETCEGGHCVCMIGYDDSNKWVICVNSWGTGWGNRGLFYLPYEYITDPNLSSDFCSISFTYSVGQKNNEKPKNKMIQQYNKYNLTKMRFITAL